MLATHKMGLAVVTQCCNEQLFILRWQNKQSFPWEPGLPPIYFIVGLTIALYRWWNPLHKYSHSFFLMPEKMGFIFLVLSTTQASGRAFTGLEGGEDITSCFCCTLAAIITLLLCCKVFLVHHNLLQTMMEYILLLLLNSNTFAPLICIRIAELRKAFLPNYSVWFDSLRVIIKQNGLYVLIFPFGMPEVDASVHEPDRSQTRA